MYVSVSSLDNLYKLPKQSLHHYPQSSLFPTMVRIPHESHKHAPYPATIKQPSQETSSYTEKPSNHTLIAPLLGGILLLNGADLIFNSSKPAATKNMRSTFSPMITGGLITFAALSTGTVYGVLRAGGFFKKDRDLKAVVNSVS